MVLYYDCFSGISGDMNLGAMIDLGVPEDHIRSELHKLKLEGYKIITESGQRNGITGTKVTVVVDEKEPVVHRHLADIEKIIKDSELDKSIKDKSIYMFRKLAESEAAVHGTSIDKVHFHEVGAVDAIVDIVGAAICLNYLKPEKILCSIVELGSGMARSAHGLLPVPAPATANLLKGIPVKSGGQSFEATTPTGAAILACNVEEYTNVDNFIVETTAYGIGHKEGDLPNVLRVFLGAIVPESKQITEHTLFECNIDDMNPEVLQYVMECLFDAGADDVFITPIIMKKSRNASKLSVLCSNKLNERMQEILLKETSTFGFRSYPVLKYALDRDFQELETSYGVVKIKLAILDGEIIRQKPEYEDCARLARENNVPLKNVYKEVDKLLNS